MSDDLSRAYWEGAAHGELVLQRCDRCGAVRHYPRILCSSCWSFDWSPVVAERSGVVYSWTVAHHVFDPTVTTEVPYTLVTVDMAAGVRVLGRYDAEAPPAPGQPVVLAFHSADGTPVPVFTPAG